MDREQLVQVLTDDLEALDNETGEGLAEMPYQDIAEALADSILRKVVTT
ncbi:hypothetical protein ACIF6L_34565 [Kitasatospora sp. NPDC086009]